VCIKIAGKHDTAGNDKGGKESERAKKHQIPIDILETDPTIPTHDDTVFLNVI